MCIMSAHVETHYWLIYKALPDAQVLNPSPFSVPLCQYVLHHGNSYASSLVVY